MNTNQLIHENLRAGYDYHVAEARARQGIGPDRAPMGGYVIDPGLTLIQQVNALQKYDSRLSRDEAFAIAKEGRKSIAATERGPQTVHLQDRAEVGPSIGGPEVTLSEKENVITLRNKLRKKDTKLSLDTATERARSILSAVRGARA